MNTITTRERILEAMRNSQDEELLNAVLRLIEAHDSDAFVGTDQELNLISKSILQQQIKEASERVKSGQNVLQEDLEKRISGW